MNIKFELIVIVALLVFSSSLAVLYFQSLIKIKQIAKAAAESFITNYVFQDTDIVTETEEVSDIHKENFIKFLSDSRDWAFDYIDKSQKQIKDFIDIADKEFAFFNTYSSLSEGQLYHETMQIIFEEYTKLKQLLPEELDDRR
jgi:predicted RNA-binding protein with EMAP domain